MCRSTAEGGRRCRGGSCGHGSTGPAQGPVYAPGELERIRRERLAAEKIRTAERDAAEAADAAAHGLPRLTRRSFLATPVTDLATVDGDTVWVSPRPQGMSEQTYREHLDTGPRMVVRTRDASTADLPERLWGGAEYPGLDPVSAQVIARTGRQRGQIVTVTWQTP